MAHLFKKVKIVQPGTDNHGKTFDLLIEEGKIKEMAAEINDASAILVEREGLCVSTGWVDLFAGFMDPGHEYKENLETGLNCASAGGFTHVAAKPDTNPVIDSAAQVNDLLRRSSGKLSTLLPIGTISKGMSQSSMAEMFDMKANGAIAFCDGKKHLCNADLMRVAMEYGNGAGVNIWSFPKDDNIAGQGYMHEGVTSTTSGIKGVPALAEELALARDIQLSEYTGCPAHFPMVSSAGSVKLLRKAQSEGIQVTAGVASYHLNYSEEDLLDLDSNLKTDPPLRTIADKKALREAVADGVITSIVSDHTPQDHEAKVREFSNADYGMINLQTSFSLSNAKSEIKLDRLIECVTSGPRNVIGISLPKLEKGAEADLTFFCPDEKWTFTKELNRSLSNNSPVLGVELIGRPIAVANNGLVEVNV